MVPEPWIARGCLQVLEVIARCPTRPTDADLGLGSDTSAGFCVASPATLSYGDEQGWKHVGWHEIERGGWNAELQKLTWVHYAVPGEVPARGSLELTDPGRFSELFRERIEATIAVERFVPLAGERGVIIAARRDLSGSGAVAWHGTLTRGLSWQTTGVRDAVDQAWSW